ncbi:MAG: hypothetical protein HYX56_01805 [Chloroflexi bacterium]|nr:hypothetical protein [Chloroflexota bacterium]
MCTINDGSNKALVCDVAMPRVRAALNADPALIIRYSPHPTDGTEIRVTSGDTAKFTDLVRAAVAEADR